VLHATRDDGRTWTTRPLPLGRGVAGFACGGPLTCTLLEYTAGGASVESVSTRDGGTTWSTAHMLTNPFAPLGLSGGQAIACPSPSSCVAMNPFNASDLYRFDLTRQAWSVDPIPEGRSFYAVACTATGTCLAPGVASEAISNDNGATWSIRAVPAFADVPIDAVSCPSGSTCFASGTTYTSRTSLSAALFVSRDAGRTWSAVTVPSGLPSIGDVSCATFDTCLAPVGTSGQMLRTTDGGATWSLLTFASKSVGDFLRSVTCASATHCVAVGTTPIPESGDPEASVVAPLSAVSDDAGATWLLYYPKAGGYFGFVNVTCSSASNCVTTLPGDAPIITSWTDDAYTTTDGGVSWSQAGSLPGSQGGIARSCAATTCWGIGYNQPGFESAPPWGLLDESTDGGMTWTYLGAPADVIELSNLAVAQNGSVVVVGTNATYGSLIAVVSL
jgi:hypothetical protein